MRDLLADSLASYPALFAACTFSGLGFPLPEDVPLLYAGIGLANGSLAWAPTIALTFTGVVLRDSLAWGIGRVLGDRLLDPERPVRFLPQRPIQRARATVQARGARAVLVGRFAIGLRAPMFMTVGASGIPYRVFLGWDLMGLCVTVPTALLVGVYVGAPALDFALQLLPRTQGLWLAIGAAALLFWAWRKRRDAD